MRKQDVLFLHNSIVNRTQVSVKIKRKSPKMHPPRETFILAVNCNRRSWLHEISLKFSFSVRSNFRIRHDCPVDRYKLVFFFTGTMEILIH